MLSLWLSCGTKLSIFCLVGRLCVTELYLIENLPSESRPCFLCLGNRDGDFCFLFNFKILAKSKSEF